MRITASVFLAAALAAILGRAVSAQECARPVDPYDSGGVLDAERAAYDVQWYGLDVRVDPSDSTIQGTFTGTGPTPSSCSRFPRTRTRLPSWWPKHLSARRLRHKKVCKR